MSRCPVCGANFPETSFVCEYCGHVITERVKQVDTGTKENSFSDLMNVIEDNLNALHEIHRPKVGETILRIFRIVLAIQTFGIALIFWKKNKKKFDKKNYEKLKAIVQRNIFQLKLSSKGSSQLLGQITIVEEELSKIDSDVRKSIRTKQIMIAVTIAAYLLLIFSGDKDSDNKTYVEITPYKTSVKGDLKGHIGIIPDNYIVNLHEGRNYLESVDITVKFKILEAYEIKEDERLVLDLYFRGEGGAYFFDFGNSETNYMQVEKMGWSLSSGSEVEHQINFKLKLSKKMFSIHKGIKHFSIEALIIKKDDASQKDSIPADTLRI